MVYIVGAGPMNSGLITRKAIQCLARADVVYYDRLIDDSVLSFVRQGIPVFFVGKSRERSFSQKNINNLLVRDAKKGLNVVRLKGGDPFLFGRGAEEALSLQEQGIKFEIVNGVSSSFACPAFAGIPLTLRGVSSAVCLVTGQEDPYKSKSAIDWSKTWSKQHTLVILMGMVNLPNIVRKLKEVGVPPTTPAAVIQEGATVWQKVETATLATIVARVREKGIRPPAVIVIGEVVGARKKLAWLGKKKLPLLNKKILVASTRNSFFRLKEMLAARGARVAHFEGVKVAPPRSYNSLDKAIGRIASYQWLVFTSKNSVQLFFDRLRHLKKDVRCLQGTRIAVIGPGTAERLNCFLLKTDLIPDDFSTQGLLKSFAGLKGDKDRVLLVRADKASDALPRGLKKLGFKVDNIILYRLQRISLPAKQFRDIIDDRPEVIAFASSENARSFFDQLRRHECVDKINKISLWAMGTPTRDTVREYGFSCRMPPSFTFQALVHSIEKECRDD